MKTVLFSHYSEPHSLSGEDGLFLNILDQTAAAFDSFPGMLVLHDFEGKYRACNKAFCEFLELPPDHIVGREPEEILAEKTAAFCRETLAACRSRSGPHLGEATIVIQGRQKLIKFFVQPLYEKPGKLEGMLVIIYYATPVEQHKRELRDLFLQNAGTLSRLLLSGNCDFTETVSILLNLLGQLLDVDRVCIWNLQPGLWLTKDSEPRNARCYEWTQSRPVPTYTTVPAYQSLPACMETLQTGKCASTLVRDLSPPERELLACRGIVSIIVAPVMVHGKLWGGVGLEHCLHEHVWTETEENIVHAAGALIGFIIHNQRVNAALRQSQDRFNHPVEESAGESIWSLDSEGRFDYVSEKMLESTGYASEELLGKHFTDLLLDPDEFLRNIPTPEKPVLWQYEHRYRTKGGVTRWARTSCQFVFENNGALRNAFGCTRDITELWEYREGMRLANETLEIVNKHLAETNRELTETARAAKLFATQAAKASAAKDTFIANMSHEIRTPLNAILGLSHLITRMALTQKQVEYLEKIDNSARSLLKIISDILDFSKAGRGEIILESRPFILENTLRDLATEARSKAEAKGLTFVQDFSPAICGRYYGDPARLSQALSHILNNAVKFTDHGTIVFTVKTIGPFIPYKTRQEGEFAAFLFSVSDTGIGIKSELLPILFDPFAQTDPSVTRRHGGTGLGLALCKQLISLMGGEIWCESEENVGSHFSCTALFTPAGDYEYAWHDQNEDNGLPASPETAGSANTEPEARARGLDGGKDQDNKTALREAEGAYFSPDGFLVPEPGDPQDSSHAPEPDNSQDSSHAPESGYSQDSSHVLESGLLAQCVSSRILLVEDNEINQLITRELLEQAGMRVTIASNGLAALEVLSLYSFDLVLMDIQMPEMDGLTAARHIRQQFKLTKLPIIAMTAHSSDHDRQKSLEAGMNAHTTKPIDPGVLFRIMADLLKKR